MLSATLTDAMLTEKPVVRFTADKKLNTTLTIIFDGIFYTATIKHANISYRLISLDINDRIRLSGFMSIRPYENKNGYPAVVKRIYCDGIIYQGNTCNASDDESCFLKYKLLKHVINNHAVLSASDKYAKGLASLEACKQELKNLHDRTIGTEIPFEAVQFAFKTVPNNLQERQAKRKRYNSECLANLVTSNDLEDVTDVDGIIQTEINEEMEAEFLDTSGRTPTSDMNNLSI
ncbi:hypothetical protein RMATCC62417_17063 [Rhizopus microsporus]|nr:hypothetical protein RMATCC62417_17063 [Rhizopus microsporus]